MLFINRFLMVGLLAIGIGAATTARAGNQLFEASWTVKSFGNERTGGTGDSEFYSAYGLPQGIQCNPNQPRCPFESTPVRSVGGHRFDPRGGSQQMAPFCSPWLDWQGGGTTARPAKGATITTGKNGFPIPPLYRNPQFFTTAGEPRATSCSAASTGATPGGKGRVQAGAPVAGTWTAITTGTQKGGFHFAPAPEKHAFGVRTTGQVGEIGVDYPYLYSYTYATLRNDAGVFGPGKGPGSFNLVYKSGSNPVASIHVTQGTAKFGGTMKMLGALTSKSCYFGNAGCFARFNHQKFCYASDGDCLLDWRYDAVGATAYTSGGVVTRGYRVTAVYYYTPTYLMQTLMRSTSGYRFPWTTGSVTVTAARGGKWRWPHETVHYAHGYDNRNTTTPSGKGTIQLVSPVLTRWFGPAFVLETAGIGILRIKFVPEPEAWVMLVTGAALLAVGARMRSR